MGEFTIPPSNNAAIEIHDDRGGYVDEYESAVWHYNIEGRKVKILGMCRSACLLALGAKNVCVGDRKSTRLNSSHVSESRMPSSA